MANGYPTAGGTGITDQGMQRYREWNKAGGVKPSDEIAGNFARGNYAQGAVNLAYGAPGWAAAKDMMKPQSHVYMGGSPDALAANRQQYDQGIQAGQGYTAQGVGMANQGANIIGSAVPLAQQQRDAGMAMYGIGLGTGVGGIGRQDSMLNSSIANASRNVGSAAQLQQQMATDAQGRQMAMMAASARGGNQAAAMRNAAAQGSQNALASNQQLALMRLQEAQNQRDAITQAQQYAAGQYGGQAQLGYGVAAQGLGAATQNSGQIGQLGQGIGGIGSNIAGVGNQMQGTYTNAEIANNEAQLKADQAWQEADAKRRAGLVKGISSAVGSMFGGGGGGGMGGMFGG